jgi:hypothetical protein
MTSLSLYTKLETLPSELKKEAKMLIDKLLENNQSKRDSSKPSVVKERKFGSLKGKIQLSDDFDAPLDEFNDYM